MLITTFVTIVTIIWFTALHITPRSACFVAFARFMFVRHEVQHYILLHACQCRRRHAVAAISGARQRATPRLWFGHRHCRSYTLLHVMSPLLHVWSSSTLFTLLRWPCHNVTGIYRHWLHCSLLPLLLHIVMVKAHGFRSPSRHLPWHFTIRLPPRHTCHTYVMRLFHHHIAYYRMPYANACRHHVYATMLLAVCRLLYHTGHHRYHVNTRHFHTVVTYRLFTV